MSKRAFVQTLKGIGPRVPLTEIQIAAEREAWLREVERYEWLKTRMESQLQRPVSAFTQALYATTRVPGALERALVALSLHENPMARAFLARYEPPADLELLYLVCRDACR